jgi:hypothetical protein
MVDMMCQQTAAGDGGGGGNVFGVAYLLVFVSLVLLVFPSNETILVVAVTLRF